ncbi:MAG: D-alanine--D-alanine ligase [Nitrospinaceae bacterium]
MDSLKEKKIGVLMGGLSPEKEISLSTGNEVFKAIQRKGLNGVMINVDHNIAEKVREENIDLAFIALHGTYGEDGAIQGLLEYAGIPYTGSGVLGSAVAHDKVLSKQIFGRLNIPTAKYQVLNEEDRDDKKREIPLPLVVKPSNQGSSIGVTIVRKEEDYGNALDLAFEYSPEVIVEEYMDGRLIAIGMNQERPLPIVEIRPKSGFYDYEAKYTAGKTEYICPAEIEKDVEERCRDVAVRVYRALKGRGFPRVDAILNEAGVPQVLEMNTIPGLTPTSLMPMAAKEAGLEFDDLIVEILKTARRDYQE